MAKKWHQLERLDHKALKKLQQEREKAAKLAKAAAEKRKIIFISVAVLLVIFLITAFGLILKSQADARAVKKAREELLSAKVIVIKNDVKGRDLGKWEKVRKKFEFSKPYSFKTGEKSSVSVQLQLENILKLAENSEMTVDIPKLEKKEIKVKEESAELKNGELTVSIALDGRDLLDIKVGRVSVKASSGLFKIIYNSRKGKGEVVVKNGVVSVRPVRSKAKGTKVTGFYKIMFKGNKIGNPTQASVIQYDWR